MGGGFVVVAAVLVTGCGRVAFDDLSAGRADSGTSGLEWFAEGGTWSARKRITIDGTRVRGDLVDFPVLVDIDDPFLGMSASGGHRETGADIVFTDADGVTRLDHEIEVTSDTGALTAWVRLPRLTAGTDRQLYIYTGNPTITAAQNPPSAVWDAGHAAVWHLSEDPSAPVAPQWLDSTGRAHCTANGTFTAMNLAKAQIAGGASWDPATTNEGDCGAGAHLANVFDGGGTISAWILPMGWGRGTYGRIVDRSIDDSALTLGYGIQVNQDFGTPRSIEVDHGFDGDRGSWTSATDSIVLGAWQHIAVVYDSSSTANDPEIYIDGVAATVNKQTIAAGNLSDETTVPFRIGNSSTSQRTFDGVLDEIRVSRVMRSADWIATRYANERTPSAFLTLGTLELR